MFNGLNCEKFKFADDGNLLLIANTVPHLALNCQITVNQLEFWCRKWRNAVNGEKTSVFYKVAKQMNVLKRYCGSNWGLKHATLIKLYKTLLLSQMLYAASVRTWKHLQDLNNLLNKALKLILRTNMKFNQLSTEYFCRIPPMMIQTDVISINIEIKFLASEIQNSQLSEIRTDKNLVDQFYRTTGTTGAHTKTTCLSYLKKRWNNIFRSPLTSTPLEPFINEIELGG